MFKCPHCAKQLIRTKGPIGIYWRCDGCEGRAVGLGLLRHSVVREYIDGIWQKVKNKEGVRYRPCPACRHKMIEVAAVEGANPTMLDVCDRCHFVWFDPDEYETMPHHRTPPKAPVVQPVTSYEEARELAYEPSVSGQAPDTWWQFVPSLFGLPSEHDAETIERPWVTWGLSVLLIIMAFITFGDLQHYVTRYGFVPATPERLWGLTFLTSFFLHAGWLHLLSNLYFLLVFGDNVEDYLDVLGFVALLVLGAVVGNIFHLLGDPQSTIPCVGASGGISSIIAFYALKFHHVRLNICIWIFVYPKWLQLPAFLYFVFWLGLQVLVATLQVGGFSTVSGLAHLGGVAVGILTWFVFRNK